MIINVPRPFDPSVLPAGAQWQDMGGREQMAVFVFGIDRDEIYRWALNGGFIDPPQAVETHKLLIALRRKDGQKFGQLRQVARQDPEIEIALDHAPTVGRNSNIVAALAVGLDVDDVFLDELWREAAQVET